MREQLLGHLLGALEDSEREQMEVRLQSDSELRSELATLRIRLKPLEAGRYNFAPPPGLAERTCRAVAAQQKPATTARRRPMSPEALLAGDTGRFRWVDLAITAAIVAVISLLLFPAIQTSRFNSQLIVCQNRLGDIGMGLKDYSHYHKGQFPSGSSLGNPQLAGILYVPILLRDGFVTNESSFICPASPSGTKAQPRMEYTSAKPPLQSGLDDLMQWGNKSYGFSLGYVCNGVHCGTKDLDRTYFALGSDVPSNDPANGRQSLNHGGTGQNVLFEDGMVRFVTSSWIIPQADDIYTNKYKLVAPGIDIDDSVIALPFVLLRY